jgi:hypothetical protein
MAGHHDDGHGQHAVALPFLEQGDAVGVRHPDVEQHEVGFGSGAQFARLLGVFCSGDDVAFIPEYFGEQFAYAHFIVND